jgi:hypothetical protein
MKHILHNIRLPLVPKNLVPFPSRGPYMSELTSIQEGQNHSTLRFSDATLCILKVKVKVPPCSTKYHAMKAYWRVYV